MKSEHTTPHTSLGLVQWAFKNKFALIVGILFLAVGYEFFFQKMLPISQAEPDIYFHLHMAERTAQEGMVKSIPQIKGLDWDQQYPEKNLLFTLLLGALYDVGGEGLVLLLPRFLGIGLLVLVFLIGAYIGKTRQAILLSFGATFSLLLFPDFLIRICLLRPHLLAMVIFVLFTWTLIERRRLFAFVSALLFTLSYHSFYILFIPLFCVGVVDFSKYRLKNGLVWGCVLAIAIGLFANPYYPLNLYWTLTNIKIALFPFETGNAPAPLELFKEGWITSLQKYGFFLIACIIGVGVNVFKRHRTDNQLTLGLIFILLSVLYSMNYRAIEYLAPICLFLILQTFAQLKPPKGASALLIAILAVLHGPFAYRYYSSPLPPMGYPKENLEALKTIPSQFASDKRKSVFNCNWDIGPYILYQVPQVDFVDLWGPYLYRSNHPKLFALRQEIRRGTHFDPYKIIKQFFKSDYVICKNRPLVKQMEASPLFKRLYPTSTETFLNSQPGMAFLYELIPPNPHYISTWKIHNSDSAPHWMSIDTRQENKKTENHVWTPFFDLRQFHALAQKPFCSKIKIPQQQLKPLEKAQWLSVQAGPKFEIHRNGKRILSGRPSPNQKPSIGQYLLKLTPPLSHRDAFDIKICGSKDVPTGISMIAFSEKELSHYCERLGLFAPGPCRERENRSLKHQAS